MEQPIALDEERTWPTELVRALDVVLPHLREYERERARIDRLAERDIMARVDPPTNPHERFRDDAIEACRAFLADARLVAVHCTRLHEDEIRDVVTNGLRPLDPTFFGDRVRARLLAGDLPAALAERLLADNDAEDEHRVGMVWLIFHRSSLRNEGGVGWLLQFWGGEALYRRHCEAPHGPVLGRIGVPCIVEAAVRTSEVKLADVAQHFLTCFLRRRRVRAENDCGMTGYVQDVVPVARAMRFGETDFMRLTNCKRWRVPLT